MAVPEARSNRPVVVVVAQAFPAHGGIASFAHMLLTDPVLVEAFDLRLLNTTRKAVRAGGQFSITNAWNAIVDSVRVFRAARRADVVHLQTALLPTPPLLRALSLCAAARLGGARVLCHVHTGLANASARETFNPTRLQRALLRGLRMADAVLTVSEAGTRGLRPFVPGGRVERVDNAVDVSRFELVSPAAAPPRILFVGTLAVRKGLLDLFAALELLRSRGLSEWDLRIVGSGSEAGPGEERTVRGAASAAGLEPALIGPLFGPPLEAALREAQIYVLPSHSEGQPIGVIEAMASGLAIVATRVGAIPDMIRDDVDGILVEVGKPDHLADALARLVASPDLRARLGRSARSRAEERFDVSRLRSRLGELYEGSRT